MIVSNEYETSVHFSSEHGWQLTRFKNGALDSVFIDAPFFLGPRLGSPSARAPWDVEDQDGKLVAFLSSEKTWKGKTLEDHEGQKFKLQSQAWLEEEVLHVHHSVVSETDSLVGNQFHLSVPDGEAHLLVDSRDHIRTAEGLSPLPEDWERESSGRSVIPLKKSFECGIRPRFSPIGGSIQLITKEYKAEVQFRSSNEESSWFISYKRENPYVSIGAVSSQDPWKPNLTVSSIALSLRLL